MFDKLDNTNHISDVKVLSNRIDTFQRQISENLIKFECDLSDSDDNNEKVDNYDDLKKRLDSFKGIYIALNIQKLADNGFYLEENFKAFYKIKCYWCNYECYIFKTSLLNNHYKSPFEDHKLKSYEICPCVNHNLEEPYHPYYKSEQMRIDTFKTWPSYMTQKPCDLAKCGFYYYGMKDIVRCFNCNIAICNWQDNEDPLSEHKQWSPNCLFIKKFDVKPVLLKNQLIFVSVK